MFQRNKVTIHGKFVNHYQYHVMAIRLGQTFDEVKIDGTPPFWRHRQGLQQAWQPSMLSLRSLTGITLLHKLLHILLQVWPDKFF
jgi:hypothetical protein